MEGQSPRKVAVVGSGCAGLAALWALNQSHQDVDLYEASDRLGGHTNTVVWRTGKYKTVVDTGFIVLNTATYPNFIRFLEMVRVPTTPTEMTFSVSRDRGLFEWAGTSLDALFCQRTNLFSPRMWRMLFDIVRFNQYALDLLRNPWIDQDQTIGQYLEKNGYSNTFRDDYLIPMTAAVWSTEPDKCTLEFPAVTLVRFLWNHHLLSTVSARPTWLTVTNGSQAYIDAIMKDFPRSHVFLNTPVRSVTNQQDGKVRLHLDDGRSALYDHVILATHGDQAYSIVQGSATQREKAVLSCFQTSPNVAVLHSDKSLLPLCGKAWASWNYLTLSSRQDSISQVCLTYLPNASATDPRLRGDD